MAKKKSYITVTDQFCGAGGSSQGVRRLAAKHRGGIEVSLAMNHWKLAIETHNTNFPDTLHDCTDISACDPRRYPSTDILITSPECTTHSPAGGNNHKTLKNQMSLFDTGKIDPATERSRATMWDVCRFAEYHKYNAIIVENVVEAKTRWPLFDNWLSCMHTLGYDHKCVYLNSMHCHPTPQSRDRMYIVFWKKGNKAPNLELTPTAWCQKCSSNVSSVQTWKNPYKQYGKYRQQYVYCCPACTSIVEPYYYASFNVIDWTNLGERIGDKKLKLYDKSFNGKTMLPLSPNTLKRIDIGLQRYGSQPMYVANYSPGYCKPLDQSIGTITCHDQHSIFSPFIIKTEHGETGRALTRSTADTLFAQTTTAGQAIITPFIINDQHQTGLDFRVKGSDEYLPTIPTTHQLKLVTPPFVVEIHSKGGARPIGRELNTVTAGAAKSGIITTDNWNAFISAYNNGSHCLKHISEETPTQATRDRNALITYRTPEIEECFYRMLTPSEVQLAMAFDKEYVILGNSRDKVKQCGNAVTPPAMEFLSERVIESLN